MAARRKRGRHGPSDESFEEWLRRELPAELRELADQVGQRGVRDVLVVAAEIEFDTYACATFVPAEVAAIGGRVEGVFRRAVRHAMATRLSAAWPGRSHAADESDVLVEARPEETPAGRLQVNPAFVAGRYRKLARGISQTVFHCRPCRGGGMAGGVPCERCGGAGRLVPEAVSDFVAPAIRRALGGRDATFHGAGREDVDVLMLGDGRPFAVTVEHPVRRTFDGAALADEIEAASGGRVTVAGLRRVGRDERRRLTTEHGQKLYRVRVAPASDRPLPHDAAERLASLSGAVVEQRTPKRVGGHRADLVRRRRVLEAGIEEASDRQLVLRLRTDPGTYVKELVSGDEGRTSPSVADLLGVPCVCAELDVIGVVGRQASDGASAAESGSASGSS